VFWARFVSSSANWPGIVPCTNGEPQHHPLWFMLHVASGWQRPLFGRGFRPFPPAPLPLAPPEPLLAAAPFAFAFTRAARGLEAGAHPS
jgi:hypothetical protein